MGLTSAAAAATPNTITALATTAAGMAAADYSDERLCGVLSSLDHRLADMWAGLPTNSLLVVATGAGDSAACERASELRMKRMAGHAGLPRWSVSEEEAHVAKLAREVQGLCWVAVKQ